MCLVMANMTYGLPWNNNPFNNVHVGTIVWLGTVVYLPHILVIIGSTAPLAYGDRHGMFH